MAFTINSPLPASLASECRKAARILNSFTDNGKGVDIIIPANILRDAKGLAIFTVLKAGFLFSGRAGSGLVVAKLPDGRWSAPSAIITGGMGFGGQIGAELTDFIMVLNTSAAVRTFMHHGSITLGGNISVAAGPIGRNAEASGTASIKNIAAVYSYSKTRGLFAGVSLEGSVIIERFDANKKMYGGKVQTRDLLNGTIPPPAAADPLYRALELKSGGSGRRGYIDHDYDRNYDSYRHHSYNRYDDTPNSRRTSDLDDFNASPMSFSRAAVHNLAKTGNSSSLRTRGNDNWRHDYDAPKPITAGHSSLSQSLVLSNNTQQQQQLRARALFNFAGEQEGDLPFHKGDIITIIKKSDTQNDWWTGKMGNREGIFPANFVELL
ncbi:uncharacterized protein BX663DRAFT_428841 [Cokeromyces recurvatus]|uniref:uncharacterized protein n=1 Tax=Cokeromyces recurvatus TaxID=90255 RepID=UPI00221F8B83|nr:uncharacterized protein BX663DRAFT_428841 [Cokeromyces recurvatus]KAI7905953.1 hypothetical protein BX663DRAFT_428841 [Cokeromyces recurvatus]